MKTFSKQELRERVLTGLGGYASPSDEEIYREIDRVILEEGHSCYGTLSEKKRLREQLFYSIRGFDVLEEYLRDDTVTEIMVIGPDKIFVEQSGVLKKTERTFGSVGEVYRLIDQMIAPLNRMVNESEPIVDGRLPDGSRVHVVLPPVSLEGPVITIRKFQKGGMTMEKLIAGGEFPPELAAVLSCLVRGRYSILISGATNSGKSSLLNALAEYLQVSAVTLSVEFRNELDIRPSDYLTTLRMEKAKELLRETNMLIGDITLAVGYEDAHVFRRRFKQYTGMTPGQYREQ